MKNSASVCKWYHLMVWDVVITAAWAVMRANVCFPHSGTLEHFSRFDAPLPFAARLLVPCLAWPFHVSGWLTVKQSFLLIDTLGFLAFLSGIRYALRAMVGAPVALLGSLVVPLMLVPAIFISAEQPPIFFPYDMTSIAFIAWGFGLVLRRKHVALAVLLPFATLNRETAVLLTLAWILLWWDRLPGIAFVRTTVLISLAFCLPRVLALFMTRSQPRPYGASIPFVEDGNLIVDYNIGWLSLPFNMALWSALLGFVPLLLFVLYAGLPDVGKRLLPLLVFQLGFLFFCGKIDEARVYAEWIVMSGVILIPAALSACAVPLELDGLLVEEPRCGLREYSIFLGRYAVPLLFVAASFAYVCLHLI